MADRDFYDVLGVKRDASQDEIKRAYRKLARKYHPDVNPGDKSAEKKFKEVQEAYDVVGDPEKRKKFDQFGRAAFEPGAAGPGGRTWNYQWSGRPGQGSPFAGFDFGGFDFSQIFGQEFEPSAAGPFAAAGRRGRPAAGRDIEQAVPIPFLVAARGGEIQLRLQTTGETIAVKIPPGVDDSSRIRLKEKGEPGPGGRSGDLYILPRVESHPVFKRQDSDIIVQAPVTVSEAGLGTKIDVPTIDGTVTMTVPPGTSSGQRLRIRGRGIAKQGGGRGDQFVEIKIVLPPKLDAESRELLKRLAERNPYNPREGSGG
jgi:DnaJ-class molecular chaperone